MGRHDKAPVRCPCSWLAALHDAPGTPLGGCLIKDCDVANIDGLTG